jgi:hypothetical protein
MILSQYHIFELDTINIYSARVQTFLFPSIKCDVQHESLSEDGQTIPCATLK